MKFNLIIAAIASVIITNVSGAEFPSGSSMATYFPACGSTGTNLACKTINGTDGCTDANCGARNDNCCAGFREYKTLNTPVYGCMSYA